MSSFGTLSLLGIHLDNGNPATYNEATSTAFAPGLLGKIFTMSNTNSFDPGSVPRTFQIVKLHASASATAVGQLMIWQDRDNFVVTNAATTSTNGNRNQIAGVVLNASLTAGNYICMQIGGQGPVLIEASVTPAIGDVIISGATTDGRCQVVAFGTAPTHLPVGLVTSLKNAGSIGTDVVEAQLFPPRVF